MLDLECLFAVKPVRDKELIKPSYGIKTLCPHKVVEKPENLDELLPLLGLGIYMAKPSIFYYASKTKIFTNVLNLFPKDKCGFCTLDGFYANINTPEELKAAEGIFK